jgi:hypothetical protein
MAIYKNGVREAASSRVTKSTSQMNILLKLICLVTFSLRLEVLDEFCELTLNLVLR